MNTTNQKQGDRQRTPRSRYGLKPKRPTPPSPPSKIAVMAGALMGSSLARPLLLTLMESLLVPILLFLMLWLETRRSR